MPDLIPAPRTGTFEDKIPCKGWYWVQPGPNDPVLIAEADWQPRGFFMLFYGSEPCPHFKWHGPIQPPEGF